MTLTLPARSQSNWDVPLNAALLDLDTRASDAYIAAQIADNASLSKAALNADFANVIGVPETATAADVNALIQAAPYGAKLWFPPVSYTFTQQILLNRSVVLIGSYGVNGTSWEGTRFNFSNATMTSIVDAIKITTSFARIEGIAIFGTGAIVAGSRGIHVTGTALAHAHANHFERCYVSGFDANLRMGDYADHVTAANSSFSTGNHGVSISTLNEHDLGLTNCLLDGNVVSSLRIENNATIANVTMIRCHLGFSQYGIYQDIATSTTGGIDGLTLIGTPIENVSVKHIQLFNSGNINIIGGYWTWNGTPANAAVSLKTNNYGVCNFMADFGQATNGSSPYIVEILSSVAFPINVAPRGTFANATINNACVIPSTSITPAMPVSSTFQFNNLGYDVIVYVGGGTITQIAIGNAGINSGVLPITSGAFRVRHGEAIWINYSVAPTWKWVAA